MSKPKRFFTVLLAGISLILAGCGSVAVATPQPTPTPITIQQDTADLTPTPTFPPYTAGAWANDPAVNTSGTVIIYAKFEHDAMPVANVPATISINTPPGATITSRAGGEQATSSDGMVAFPLSFSNLPAHTPITVTITFNYLSQSYSANAFFAASLTAPTPTEAP